MESQQGVFKSRSGNGTYADVKEAIAMIDTLLATTFDKSIFRDMLHGFKILIKSLQQKKEHEEASICDILLKWLKLYLRTQNALHASDDKLQKQFEKFVPASISYIIAALQYIPKDSVQYHFEMLDLLLKLLDNVTESTLKTVANLESGLILFLWRPIDFVGDFNTQMMAFRILVKLLKCLNDSKQCEILKTLQQSDLQESIYSAVRVYNYPAGKFEKIARDFLNHYNMNLAHNNVLVYSMRCKSVIFGNGATFYKNLHEDQLWLDLNYSPRTLTFKSRFRPNKKTGYINVGVTLHIAKFSLNENILSSVLEAPPQFTKTTTQLDKLKALREVRFVLPDEESLRLRENQCVIDHYNAASNLNKSFESQANTPLDTSTSDEDQSHNTNVSCTPKEAFILTPPKSQNNASKKTCDNFQKSYDLLIARPGQLEINTSNTETAAGEETSNMQLGVPSLPSYEMLNRKNNSVDINDSPKTSRPLEDEMKTGIEKVQHPLAELSCPQNNRRRFFKRKSDSSDDTKQCTKKCKRKTHNVKRNRTKKIVTSPPKRKQVNKVKPMNHLAKDDGDPEEAAQEYVENGGIVNITNFLRNGNESAAVFSDDQKRIILKNVNRISDGLERSAKRFFRRNESGAVSQMANSTINGNIYDQSESEAEPGRSYRNFVTRRPNQEKPKQRRTRKNANAIKSATEKTNKQTTRDDDSVPSTSRAAAERILQNKRKRAAVSSPAASSVANTIATDKYPSKVSKIESKKSQDKTLLDEFKNTIATDKHTCKFSQLESKICQNQTILADIEIDLTIETDNDCIENNLKAKLSDTKRISQAAEENSNAGTKNSFFKRIFQQTRISNSSSPSLSSVEDNSNDNEKQNEVVQQPPLDNINNNIEEFNEIQDCRDSNVIHIIANDMLSSPIDIIVNKTYSPALSDVIDEIPQKINAVLLSGNKENENVDNRSTQIETNKNNFFENSFRKISSMKKTPRKQAINFNRRESVRPSQEIFNDCILYHSRSETESSDDTDQEASSVDHEEKFLKQPFKTPTKFTVEHTSKKSVTRSTRNSISLMQPTRKVTTSITHKVISEDVFIVPHTTEIDENSFNDDLTMEINELPNDSNVISNFPVVDAVTTNCVAQYFNEMDVTQHQMTKDVSQLLYSFQQNIISKFEDVHKESNSQKNTLDTLIKKIIDLGERMIIETEKQRLEMEESEIEIDKILCRLNWHWDVLQAKTERFYYFKENMEQLLDSVTNISIEEEINNEFGQNLSTIQEHGSKIRKKQWTEYVDSFTKNLLQNVSRLSAL